jgi:tripartite-type tricarboxylate transporter receptor subunit TctC
MIHNVQYPSCLLDDRQRIWDVNEAFACAFLDFHDRDACLAELRGQHLVQLLCAARRSGRWLRSALSNFDVFARRQLLVLQRVMQPGDRTSAVDEALLNEVLEDRALCAIWLSLSAHLPEAIDPDYTDHQSLEVTHPDLEMPVSMMLWNSVPTSDERFRVLHLAPANDATAAEFAAFGARRRPKAECPQLAHVQRSRPSQFPLRSLTLTVPWAVGGATDVGARIFAPLLSRELGQPVEVANCDAVKHADALAQLARVPADGHHLVFINQPAFDMAVSWDPDAIEGYGFRFVATQAFDPMGAFVRADSPYVSLQDLVRDAGQREHPLVVGTSGMHTPAHLSAVMLERHASIRFAFQHYQGSLEHIARFLAGQTDVAFFGSGITLPSVQAGELRALAMFTERRFALLAQTPTAAEQGFRGVVLSSMRALWVPDGVSESVFDALQTAVTATLRTEIHRQQMHAAGLEVQILNAAEYKNELARQSAAYRRLVPGLQWAAA